MLETYYYDLSIRLFALITLSLILSGFYLRYLTRSDSDSFFKQEKSIYSIQAMFWVLFLSDLLGKILPNNVLGSFIFELILLSILFISYTFLLWKFFKKKKFDLEIFFISFLLIILFLLALGMN